ncbi:TPA: hypothetical protein N0F65_008183 [Lagenidium giganteum]|uniref:Uncharacterized protein n=1 Tax=Lagenidium giganteum TaxID=4803 RepID=A0AAV2YI00_9STRA|nr:TPA: hypothetical protein N0F65_008183 [Lagenidium giganteum]
MLSEFKGKVTAFYGSVFEPLLMLCFEVAECESKTYAASLQSRPRPRKKPTARSAKKQSKKTVRFRSFDMSCLNLQYVEDDRSAAVVDNVLQHYDEIMEQARAVVQFAADSTNDELLKKSLELMDKCCEEKDRDADSTQIFLEAFARADTHLQHEIKVCGHYYATELTSMLSSHSTTRKDDSAPFLVQMFSGLLSSAVRYKLRVIFLPLDPNRVSEEPSEDQNDELCRPDHPYNHQDLGAAVHRALEELHTFEVAKNSVLQLAEGRELESFSSEDMDVVVQYSSAVRFLHFYLTQSLSTLHMEDGNDETWAEVRSLCSMAQRFVNYVGPTM